MNNAGQKEYSKKNSLTGHKKGSQYFIDPLNIQISIIIYV